MKKIALCFAVLLLFFSCGGNNWDDTVITNESSEFDVTFKFSNTGEIDLPRGMQTTFPTEAHQYLKSYSHEKRVYFTYLATNDGYTGWFREFESWTVKVNNSLGVKVTLEADGWMDEMIDIESGDTDNDNHTGKVYTDNPTFIVTKTENNFPAVAVYERDDENKVFNVTIR